MYSCVVSDLESVVSAADDMNRTAGVCNKEVDLNLDLATLLHTDISNKVRLLQWLV